MTISQGFWSYVHADDQAEGERISRLAHDVVNQFQMLTGEAITLFLDRDALTWGDNWRDKIDTSLSSVAFFIPVITPRYFMSPECRRELQFFARRASELGIKELILPLLYIDFDALHNETTDDDLIKLINTFQWENWADIRFLDVMSEGYRRGVAKLAARLVEANKRAEEISIATTTQMQEISIGDKDDMPGVIDSLAKSEEMLLKLPETLQKIAQDISEIGQFAQEATSNIQNSETHRKGFAARLIIIRQLASQLSEPVERIWSLSNLYASQLHDVDVGFRIIIEQAPSEIKDQPENKQNFCTFFEMVCTMSNSSNGAIVSFEKMVASFEPLEKMSRDLRPVLRRLKQGLTVLIESSGVSNEWVHLIDISGITCEDAIVQIQ